MIWLVFALMTAAAVSAVLWPLRRGGSVRDSDNNLAVYRDQLAEIERDRAADRIGDREAEAARIEVSRRLLGAAEKRSMEAREPAAPATWRRRAAGLATITMLPLGALGLYLWLGSPDLPGEPLQARRDMPPGQGSFAALIAQVEAHLQRNPQEGRGWEVLAPVYLRLGRLDEAVAARRHALRLLGATATREADLGEALVAQANGIVTEDARRSFERALAIDGNDIKARFFIGLAAEQDGRRQEAAAIWRDLIAKAPAGASWVEFVQSALARVEGTASAEVQPKSPRRPSADSSSASAAPGPSEQDMAAAAELTPQQRNDMVRGMVDRLAERLKQDGSDLDGWLRLVRAYAVLGERDKARAAAADARRALASAPDKLRRLDELVKGLGLEG
ncbi:MAG TPA: c-type cytochrome biogenesis protein CcmI [Xanthobacteraceae bacterium]|nr:c-type cytochrome biogenesis protein CcmI [Xanthobacteraceae bacterium]